MWIGLHEFACDSNEQKTTLNKEYNPAGFYTTEVIVTLTYKLCNKQMKMYLK